MGCSLMFRLGICRVWVWVSDDWHCNACRHSLLRDVIDYLKSDSEFHLLLGLGSGLAVDRQAWLLIGTPIMTALMRMARSRKLFTGAVSMKQATLQLGGGHGWGADRLSDAQTPPPAWGSAASSCRGASRPE